VTVVGMHEDAAAARSARAQDTSAETVADGSTASATSRTGTPLAHAATSAAPPRAADGAVPTVARRHTVLGDLRDITRDLAQSRDLLQQLTLRDIRIRYKQAAFGFAWALLMPMVIVLAGLAIRAAIAYAAGVQLNTHQIGAMAVKAVPWAFFVGCINMGTPSLISNIQLVTKVYFPREVLPLAAVLAQSFDSSIGALLVACILPLFGIGVSLQLLWVPALLVCLWTFAVACVLFLSCANLFFRDVKYLVQVFLTFGIFLTPVLMDASMFGPKGASIIMLNPVAPLLEGLRLAIVEHHNLLRPYTTPFGGFLVWRPWYLAYSFGWAFLGLLGSALLFHRSERRFAEII
jgi:lipopolysaccharide transport system permease protein